MRKIKYVYAGNRKVADGCRLYYRQFAALHSGTSWAFSGDRVTVEAAPPRRLIITKECRIMTSSARLELEVEILEKRKAALDSEESYELARYAKNMPSDVEMIDHVGEGLIFYEFRRDRDRLEVEVAEKKLELFDLQGGGGQPRQARPVLNLPCMETGVRKITFEDG
jgi:hypothetical protein